MGDAEDLFYLLDVEVLDQIVSRLTPEDALRLGCTSSRLKAHISSGRHALHLWLRHCRDLLGELAVAHVAASCKADQAVTWLRLYASARMLDRLHWSPAAPAPSNLTLTSHSSPSAQHHQDQQQDQQLVVPTRDAAALLARTGHTATAAAGLLVLIGGDLRDGPAPAVSDVCVLDLPGGRLIQPRLHGRQPPSLREHCTVLLHPQQGSALHQQVSSAIAEALADPKPQDSSSPAAAPAPQQLASQGHTLAVFGGLLADGTEQACDDQLHVLWLAPDATWGVWLHPSTTGPAPAPRAYACCAGTQGGTQLLVYGGWVNGSMSGTVQSDVGVFDGYLLLCVYLLDTATLSWSRVATRPLNEPPRPGHVMLGPSTCPGPRRKALSCLQVNPVTGLQEFMLLGGCGVDGLADFVPYSLDLQTFYWTKGPVMGYLPPARTHSSVTRLTPEWLVLVGGQGPSKQHLQDVQRLHLPTLSWRPPVHVAGSSSSNGSVSGQGGQWSGSGQQAVLFEDAGACAAAGCSADAGVLVGGVQHGAYGSCIVPRLQLLLPGPVIPPAEHLHDRTAVTPGSGTAGLAGLPQGFAHMQLLLQQQQQPQQLAAWHAFATSSCRCGSCCSCLAAKAAASGGPLPSACCNGAAAAASSPPHPQRGSQQRPSSGTGGAAPNWQGRGFGAQQRPSRGKGGGQGSPCDGGKCQPTMQGPVGWSGELEIQPAPPAPGTLGTGSRQQAGGWQAPDCTGASTGTERVWQTGSSGSSSSTYGWVLQVVLACFVVMIGLVLMAPSLLMHQER